MCTRAAASDASHCCRGPVCPDAATWWVGARAAINQMRSAKTIDGVYNLVALLLAYSWICMSEPRNLYAQSEAIMIPRRARENQRRFGEGPKRGQFSGCYCLLQMQIKYQALVPEFAAKYLRWNRPGAPVRQPRAATGARMHCWVFGAAARVNATRRTPAPATTPRNTAPRTSRRAPQRTRTSTFRSSVRINHAKLLDSEQVQIDNQRLLRTLF
eukprot:6200923-Pleurochrysis_carterae.AAC.2